MNLIEQAKADIEDITSNADEWAKPTTFTDLQRNSVTVNAIHTKHHLAVDTDGAQVNSKNAHVAAAEKKLLEAGYTTRKNGEVNLINHKVVVKDSSGLDKSYTIRDQFPDDTIGIIVCILTENE